jgi:hypothetical protein
MKWTSVKDRLPSEDGRYLVCVKRQARVAIHIALFYNGFFCRFHDEHAEVTHWMLLPEIPEGENCNER